MIDEHADSLAMLRIVSSSCSGYEPRFQKGGYRKFGHNKRISWFACFYTITTKSVGIVSRSLGFLITDFTSSQTDEAITNNLESSLRYGDAISTRSIDRNRRKFARERSVKAREDAESTYRRLIFMTSCTNAAQKTICQNFLSTQNEHKTIINVCSHSQHRHPA